MGEIPHLYIPDGFRRLGLPGINTFLTIPEGWHCALRGNQNVRSYFVTEHNLAGKDIEFETGFWINVFLKLQEDQARIKFHELAAVPAGAQLIEVSKQEERPQFRFWNRHFHEPLNTSLLSINSPQRVFTHTAWNKTTNTIYSIGYKTPEAQISQNQPPLETIVKQLILDSSL